MKIGVCGTGRMGSSIAQRLMAVGHEVGVWNRDAAKTKPLTEAGAQLFASPAELAKSCDTVVVMLLNDAATEAVYRGPNGILQAGLAGKPGLQDAVRSAIHRLGCRVIQQHHDDGIATLRQFRRRREQLRAGLGERLRFRRVAIPYADLVSDCHQPLCDGRSHSPGSAYANFHV